MHIVKDITTGLLFSPFAVGGTWRLQAAVIHYFDLMEPDVSLSEQDMWPEIAVSLGQGGILDPGFPKSRGEVLVASAWHAPGGKPVAGGRVSLNVGPIARELLVFGDRHWEMAPGGPRPSQPKPALSIPLTWEYAYGGGEFPENPRGLGHMVRQMPWNEQRLPLPNVEDPARGLMGTPSDTPVPASLGIRILDAPSRLAQAGTYGQDWLKRYWPGFPPDVEPDYFQLADPAQRLAKGFFEGGEKIFLEGMHPRFPRIESRLPRKRARVFATRAVSIAERTGPTKNREKNGPVENSFEEYTTSLETVWLFPELLRGAVLYRTILPCADDVASDIIRLFPVLEDSDAPFKDIHYWREEEAKHLPTKKPMDTAPLEKAKQTMEEVKAGLRTAEEDIHHSLDQAEHLAPILPMSHADQIGRARKRVQKALDMVNEAEERLKNARKLHGHMMKIDPSALKGTRANLLGMLAQLDTLEKRLAEGVAEVLQAKAEGYEKAREVKEILVPQTKRVGVELPVDPEKILDEIKTPMDPPANWSEAALALLASHAVFDTEYADPLLKMGIRSKDLFKAGFAFLPEPLPFDAEQWFLTGEKKGTSADFSASAFPSSLPSGYLIPWFQGRDCVRLAIRPLPEAGGDLNNNAKAREDQSQADTDSTGFITASSGTVDFDAEKTTPTILEGGHLLAASAKARTIQATDPKHPEEDLCLDNNDVIVPGSGEGVQILGAWKPKPLLLAPDPLAGWLLYREAGDICAIVIATSPAAGLPAHLTDIVANAPFALWPVSPLIFPPPPIPPPADHLKPTSAFSASSVPTASPPPPPQSPSLSSLPSSLSSPAQSPSSPLLPSLPFSGIGDAFKAKAEKLAAPWRELLPGLEIIVWDADFPAAHLAAARRKGLPIRAWLFGELEKRGIAPPSPEKEGGLVAEVDEEGKLVLEVNVPKVDVTGIRKRASDRVKGMMPEPSPFPPEIEAGFKSAKEKMVPYGIAIPEFSELAGIPAGGEIPPFPEIDLSLLNEPEKLLKQHASDMVPELEGVLDKGHTELNKALHNLKDTYDGGVAQIQEGERLLNSSLAEIAPAWVKDVPGAEAILNPETMTPELAAEKLRTGQTYGLSLKDLDMRGMDLSGCQFKEMFLENIDFSRANLRGARFEKVVGENLDFSEAVLEGASFRLSSLKKSRFVKTDCRNMRMELCNLSECPLISPDTEGAFFRLASLDNGPMEGRIRGLGWELFSLGGTFENLVFEECHMRKGSIQDSTLSHVRFEGGIFEEVGFITCQGEDFSMVGVNARNARFIETTLRKVLFKDTSLKAAVFRKSELTDAKFIRCSLERANVERTAMPFVIMERCRAPKARICHTDLEGASLVRFSLPGGSLRRTRLVRADLTDANLYGADLYKAVFGETMLHGANLTQTLLQDTEGILRREGMSQQGISS